jgi:hypothetical protein
VKFGVRDSVIDLWEGTLGRVGSTSIARSYAYTLCVTRLKACLIGALSILQTSAWTFGIRKYGEAGCMRLARSYQPVTQRSCQTGFT